MSIADTFIADLKAAAEKTRKCFERIPQEKWDWKPHEKSMSMEALASHIADMPRWMISVLEEDVVDLSGGDYTPFRAADKEALLKKFDDELAAGLAALAGRSDEYLQQPWKMLWEGQVVIDGPRFEVIRQTILDHIAHHRGQLTVYLRLNDVPVPGVYGPSADEH